VKLDIETKLLRYLLKWPSGLTTPRMRAWIDSCTKAGGYPWQEFEAALYSLRDSSRIACVNGIWYLKDIPSSMKE
jgi:hypothetical protein